MKKRSEKAEHGKKQSGGIFARLKSAVKKRDSKAKSEVATAKSPNSEVVQAQIEDQIVVLNPSILPLDLWYLVFSHLENREVVTAASVCQLWRQVSHDFLQRNALFPQKIISRALLESAAAEGIYIPYAEIYRLTREAPEIFRALASDQDNAMWAFAAICGDLNWLQQHALWAFEPSTEGTTSILTKKCAGHSIAFYYGFANTLTMESTFACCVAPQTDENYAEREALLKAAAQVGQFKTVSFLMQTRPAVEAGDKDPFREYSDSILLHYYARHAQRYKMRTYPRLEFFMNQLGEEQTRFRIVYDVDGYTATEHAFIGGEGDIAMRFANIVRGTFIFPDSETHPNSALHVVARYGQLEVIIGMVEHAKMAVDITNQDGHLPIHCAAIGGSWECFNYLFMQLPADQSWDDKKALLQECESLAEKHGHPNFVNHLHAKFDIAEGTSLRV